MSLRTGYKILKVAEEGVFFFRGGGKEGLPFFFFWL